MSLPAFVQAHAAITSYPPLSQAGDLIIAVSMQQGISSTDPAWVALPNHNSGYQFSGFCKVRGSETATGLTTSATQMAMVAYRVPTGTAYFVKAESQFTSSQNETPISLNAFTNTTPPEQADRTVVWLGNDGYTGLATWNAPADFSTRIKLSGGWIIFDYPQPPATITARTTTITGSPTNAYQRGGWYVEIGGENPPNTAPTAPTNLTSPAQVDLGDVVPVTWQHNDVDGNPQAAFQTRVRRL